MLSTKREFYGTGYRLSSLLQQWQWFLGALMNYPPLFCPRDNLEHCLALPTRSRTSVRALSFPLWSDPKRCEMNRKVRAPRRISASGAPHIVPWIKQTWIKRQCTPVPICYSLRGKRISNSNSRVDL